MKGIAEKLKKLQDIDDKVLIDSNRKDELIIKYAPYIRHVAKKIFFRMPATFEIDDLFSAGVIGLMDAINKYDATRENKFKTYAEFRIRGAIIDEVRSQDWIPRSIREKAKLLERTFSKLEGELNRSPSENEVMQELGLKEDIYRKFVNRAQSISILNIEETSSFSKQEKNNLSVNEQGTNPFLMITSSVEKERLKDAIKSLPEKLRLVLSLYYYEDLNLRDIGKVLDVSESRACQLHIQALKALKSKLESSNDAVNEMKK
jgi:RNA polymerase sigma factor for flagellar operon FliA